MIKKKVKIINRLGIHARAAAKLVSHANRYGSTIDIVLNERTTNAKSILGVMTLAATKGMEIELIIEGDDEKAALEDIENLISDRFGEKE